MRTIKLAIHLSNVEDPCNCFIPLKLQWIQNKVTLTNSELLTQLHEIHKFSITRVIITI